MTQVPPSTILDFPLERHILATSSGSSDEMVDSGEESEAIMMSEHNAEQDHMIQLKDMHENGPCPS